jgi:hypothetical protein
VTTAAYPGVPRSETSARIAELLALRKTLADTRGRADACTDEQPVIVCALVEDHVMIPRPEPHAELFVPAP